MTTFEERVRAHLEAEQAAVPPLRPAGTAPHPVDRLGGLGRWMLGAAAAVLVMVTVVGAMRWPDARSSAAGDDTGSVVIAGRAVPVAGSVAWAGGTVYVGVPVAGSTADGLEGESQELERSDPLTLESVDGLDPATAVYLGNLPGGDAVIVSGLDTGRSILGWLGGVFGGGEGWCLVVGTPVGCQSELWTPDGAGPYLSSDQSRVLAAWGGLPDGTVSVELTERSSGRVLLRQTPVSGVVVFEAPFGTELVMQAIDASGDMLVVGDLGAVPVDGWQPTTSAVDTTAVGWTTTAP